MSNDDGETNGRHKLTCRSLKGCSRRPRGSLALFSRAWVWGMLLSVHLKVLETQATGEAKEGAATQLLTRAAVYQTYGTRPLVQIILKKEIIF